MELLFLCVILFVIIVALSSDKKTKQLRNSKKVADILKREYEKEKSKLEEKVAEKDALVKALNEIKVSQTIDDNEMLIDKSAHEDICRLLKETCDMIIDICRERDFQTYILGINIGSDSLDNSQKMYESLKFFIIKDVLRNYERLGHKYFDNDTFSKQKRCSINYDTPEGQLLHIIVMQMMRLDEHQQFLWDECKSDIVMKDSYSQQIRKTVIEALNTYANADVKVTASNGLDDFAFCMLLHNYSKDYENAYRKNMLRIATIIATVDNKVTEKENQWLDSIVNISSTDDDPGNQQEVVHPDEELNGLIGLGRVKNEINTLCNFVIMKKKREAEGLKSPNISYHCVFTGNPGTGKTTVARLLAAIYRDLGVLKKGHLVETDRSGLVAEYVGQTAVKTNKIIDSALDGVLFIDEAYTLANGSNNDYGPEAIATLLKRMEDDRNHLVVILAGYNQEMETFINSNPGLRSRFNRYIHFDDYTAEELFDIFCLLVKKGEYTLTEDAVLFVKELLKSTTTDSPKDFGNARFVRNLFEKVVEAQANRLSSKTNLTKEELTQITKADVFYNMSDRAETPQPVSLNHDAYLEAKKKFNQAKNVEKNDMTEESVVSEEADYGGKGIEDDITSADNNFHSYDDCDTIEVSYTVFGYDNLDETIVDVEIKECELEWLTEKDESGEYLDSDFISENRRSLHKRILRAIREDIEYVQDGNESAIDDDDIEYTITL